MVGVWEWTSCQPPGFWLQRYELYALWIFCKCTTKRQKWIKKRTAKGPKTR